MKRKRLICACLAFSFMSAIAQNKPSQENLPNKGDFLTSEELSISTSVDSKIEFLLKEQSFRTILYYSPIYYSEMNPLAEFWNQRVCYPIHSAQLLDAAKFAKDFPILIVNVELLRKNYYQSVYGVSVYKVTESGFVELEKYGISYEKYLNKVAVVEMDFPTCD